MPTYQYRAVDYQGTGKSGLHAGEDARKVTEQLRQQGLFVLHIEQSPSVNSPPQRDSIRWPGAEQLRQSFAGVSPRDLAVFTRQLGTLLRAGMPLVRSLEVLGRQQTSQKMRQVIESLVAEIRAGAALSEALTSHEAIFGRLYINMVRAGEAGGVLDTVFDRLATYQEKSRQVKGKVGAALAYPLIVLAVAVILVGALMLLVVPKFERIFADMLKGAPLPPLTRAVLTISEALRQHGLLIAVGVVLALGAIQLARTSRAGARGLDAVLMRLPVWGGVMLKVLVARFARTLGTLLASGVPVLTALLITRDACGNARLAAAVTEVHDRVKAGATLARPLEEVAVFPPMVTSMVEVGEHTGQLPQMLGKLADIYEDEVESTVAGLSSLIEPVMILFLALVVGTIVIALFLPIIRIVQLLS